jgi:hypothetical protein
VPGPNLFCIHVSKLTAQPKWVKLTEISNHIAWHSTINIGQILLMNRSTISWFLMGEMVEGFHIQQRWRLLDSNRLYTVKKLAKVSMGKAWWTIMVNHLDIQASILIKLFPSYYLTSNKCISSLVWSNSSTRLHSSQSIIGNCQHVIC